MRTNEKIAGTTFLEHLRRQPKGTYSLKKKFKLERLRKGAMLSDHIGPGKTKTGGTINFFKYLLSVCFSTVGKRMFSKAKTLCPPYYSRPEKLKQFAGRIMVCKSSISDAQIPNIFQSLSLAC